jgi:hypothetical protein
MSFVQYVRNRHFCKSHGFGKPWLRPLCLDAVVFASARWLTLHSPLFWIWCRDVDRLFREQYDWPRSMTTDTGRDCWIDAYWEGLSAQDAVDSEVDHWEE